MNLSKTFIFSTILAATAATAGVIDDAKFKLDLRGDLNDNAFIDRGEVGNALDYSAESPLQGQYGAQGTYSTVTPETYTEAKWGTLPQLEQIDVANPCYPNSEVAQTCLHFYHDSYTKDGKVYAATQGITFPGGAVSGNDGVKTIYVRCRRDGVLSGANPLVFNGFTNWGTSGQGLYATGGGDVGMQVDGNGTYTKLINLNIGKWYDIFAETQNQTINGKSVAVTKLTACTPTQTGSAIGFNVPSFTTAIITNTAAMNIPSGRPLSLGCFLNNNNGYVYNSNGPRAFRGVIADVMIWDRALTDTEKVEVVAGPSRLGGEWQIGAANGSADEFDDADPAAVYDVQSMPWRRMRKSLDSTNPSLSISTTMTADEAKRNRTLTLAPILSGASTAPVEVSLNGTVVGSIDLATTTSITLPRRLWLHGSGLANTITVTRTAPLSGTVRLDAVSLATGDYGEAGGVMEDATFKLDLRGGESTYTQPGVLGNALDFSAASPLAGYMGDQRGPQTYNANFGNLPAQETADVQNPYYPYTTNSQTVLHFYQDFKGEDKGSVNSGVVIPGAAPKGLVQTYYLRFRWDGEAPAKTGGDDKSAPVYILQSGQSSNGNNVNNGVAINLNGITVSGATTNAVLACRVGASGTSRYPEMTATISAGKWVDAFVTFEANADNTGFTTTFSVCSPSPTGGNFNPPSLVTQVVSSSGGLSFDSTNLSLGLYHDSANTRSTTRCFRGLIADFMTWERTLTDAEKIEVMAGQHGAKWRIGAINGSADEFTDTDPAAVFEPQSMPWRQMRKTLDASHPTLTLKSPLATFETGKPMILHVDPIFTGTGASVPMSVSVNGDTVGSFDLAEKRNFIIERGNWQRDGSGNVTITITRTETTGSVAIDALSLSGSWQITDDDRGSNGMINEKYAASLAFAGDNDAQHFTSSLSVGASHTNYTFGVWVPAGMGAECGWKFRTKTTGTVSDPNNLQERHTVYVNGSAVGAHEGRFGTHEAFSLDIPAGTLHDGMNYVQWVQTLPTRADQQSNTGSDGKPAGIFQYYDFWGMTLVPPANPFEIIMR